MADGASYHAIYLVLDDVDFLEASLRSVYPHVTGITVVTSHDQDRFGRPVTPDRTVELLLSRALDPERKIDVIVSSDVSEPALRNRAMSFAHPERARRRALREHGAPPPRPKPDWFWIVDADEVYEPDAVHRLKDFVATNPAKGYFLGASNYFRSWNWRIEQTDRFLAVVEPGLSFGRLRFPHRGRIAHLVQKLEHERVLPERVANRLQGLRVVPREVAFFHHGSFVGDRRRIETKLARSGHRDDVAADWLTRVWDQWTPEMRDLHPSNPPLYPSTSHVATDDLPAVLRDHDWPDGWIERAP